MPLKFYSRIFGDFVERVLITSNENKMSDGGRHRASLGMEVWKSSQKVERTAVRRSLHRGVRPRDQIRAVRFAETDLPEPLHAELEVQIAPR
jgi:hypothetical protein